ncbi:hypothetical protein GHT06_018132 [Daphnia sinensis]|uniref:FERM domain-containing protein n=1 Tax=Daphnia sinensis TaxID=1820382 RepID=A0AAD5PQL0_9CRUS|nr:hypothetical protein GHT06_018132 [Daphnia sinensis]
MALMSIFSEGEAIVWSVRCYHKKEFFMENLLGLNMRINCFGDKVSSLHCKIVLLDEQQLVHEVLAETTGQDVLNVVYQHLGSTLLETAYFGLRYVDATHQPQWLDPNKRVLQQLKGTGSQTLYFAVKFYAVDPCKLVEELTRYQFFLQVKKDILQGRLPVTTELAAELAALALQSELGDYDPQRYKPGYVSEFRFLAHQSPDLETKIDELHKTMRGLVPAVAEMRYLDRVKWLDLYGVDLHPVLGEDTVEYFLGLTPSGIIVLRNKTKVGNYFWPRISKIQFKGRYFMLRVRDKSNDESTFGFETPSKSACKSLYKCCSQHLAFFRLVQMSGPLLTSASTSTIGGTNTNANQNSLNSIGSKFLKLSGAAAPTSFNGQQQSQNNSPPQFRRMPSRRHQRRIVDGASHPAPPPMDECSTSDSDKTLDVASTANLLSPYHSKIGEAKQPVLAGGGNGVDNWTEASSVRSRRSRSRSHSRNRKENRRPSSADSSVESRPHRRKNHRSRSRHNSDNESEGSRVSESDRSNSRRRRHRSSRDSSGSESDHQSSNRRSHRRNRRRSSQGSTYELVDSEAQWREIQERQGLKQSQTATVRPAASSTPVQQPPIQQATVRKSSTNAANISTSSANDSLLDQSQSDVTTVETNSQVSSSRHRHHRKHNHRHHHKHRSHSRHSEKSVKPLLPSEIMPHLQFQLVDPPAGSTSDQLREIPYQVVTSPQPVSSSALHHAVDDSNDHQSKLADNLNRKRHRDLHPPTYPEERKIISVDNDSPPPPYSPPQNVDALAQSLASLSIPPVSRSRGRPDNNTNNSSNTHCRTARTALNANPPPIAARPPPAPIPGPKPNKPTRPQGDFSAGQKNSSSYSPQYAVANNTSAHHPGNNAVPNGYHYAQPGVTPGHVAAQQYGNNTSSMNHHNMQYHHQDNRRTTAGPPAVPPPSASNSSTSSSSSSSAFNGFHYPYSSQANTSAPISPHHVGLPLTAFSANHSIPSPQVPAGSTQQASKTSVAAPMVLPRMNVPSTPTPSIQSGSGGSSNNSVHSMEKNKGSMPMSPLANGVTETCDVNFNTAVFDELRTFL